MLLCQICNNHGPSGTTKDISLEVHIALQSSVEGTLDSQALAISHFLSNAYSWSSVSAKHYTYKLRSDTPLAKIKSSFVAKDS